MPRGIENGGGFPAGFLELLFAPPFVAAVELLDAGLLAAVLLLERAMRAFEVGLQFRRAGVEILFRPPHGFVGLLGQLLLQCLVPGFGFGQRRFQPSVGRCRRFVAHRHREVHAAENSLLIANQVGLRHAKEPIVGTGGSGSWLKRTSRPGFMSILRSRG